MFSLLCIILLHKCHICSFEVSSNSEIVMRNCRRGISNYDTTNFSEKMKINPIFQRPLGQRHHHLPRVPAWVRSGTATIISAKYPTFISLGITTETKYCEKAHCTMQGRLQTLPALWHGRRSKGHGCTCTFSRKERSFCISPILISVRRL